MCGGWANQSGIGVFFLLLGDNFRIGAYMAPCPTGWTCNAVLRVKVNEIRPVFTNAVHKAREARHSFKARFASDDLMVSVRSELDEAGRI
jgi:hypothetical protein